MEKEILLGNKALARGAYEAGVTFASAYPGTPSTEITEEIAKYSEIYAEWSPNEKVATEAAIGASIMGARSMVCMKHVGLNVAADPVFTYAYSGVNGGMVIVVADDPGMHSSQNEQDSRFYARSAHIPMLEPSDSQEAKDFMKLAFRYSEKYDTPVMIRMTTRVAHSQSFVELGDRVEIESKPYEKKAQKYVMAPANAKARHLEVEKRELALKEDCEEFVMNDIDYRSTKLGIVCSGAVYQYVKEAVPEASIFKLGMVYPLPIRSIRKFADNVEELLVIEELEPFIENQLKANGIACKGKELFSLQGELSVEIIRNKIYGTPIPQAKQLPIRPPILCAGCPHRGVFYAIAKNKYKVYGDIGCYTLGATPPLNAIDAVICMGASIGMAHGAEKATGIADDKLAVIGDSTFIHSGITGLINAVYNQSNITVVILDNSTTGMTGHQQHPATGKTLKGEITYALNLEELVKACGVQHVEVVDAYDIKATEASIRRQTKEKGVSVVIAKRPCVLLSKNAVYTPLEITDQCRKCKACTKIGCPAIIVEKDQIRIDAQMCIGCGVCQQLCAFGAIQEIKKDGKNQ